MAGHSDRGPTRGGAEESNSASERRAVWVSMPLGRQSAFVRNPQPLTVAGHVSCVHAEEPKSGGFAAAGWPFRKIVPRALAQLCSPLYLNNLP